MSEQLMTHEHHEQPPKNVDLVMLCDLDRAMIKSDKLVDVVRDFLLIKGKDRLSHAEMDKIFDHASDVHKGVGGAEQPYEKMREEFGLEEDPGKLADEIVELFGLEELRERVLVPGADMLFAAMKEENIEHGILTSATDTVGQRFKIAIFEQLIGQKGIPYWIVNHHTKASTAEDQWLDVEAQRFNIPAPDNMDNGGWRAKQVCLVDDKTKNLETSSPREDIIPIHVYADDVPASDAVSVLEVANAVVDDQDLSDLRWDQSKVA